MKKILIILILLFSLNINFNAGYTYFSRQRNPIVYIINYREDNLTSNTIDKARRMLVEMYISLLIDFRIAEKISINDTS